MHSFSELINKALFILGDDKKKFYLFIPSFLILSFLDLIGLSLIAPIVFMLTDNPEVLVNKINELIFSRIGVLVDFKGILIFLSLFIIFIFSLKASFAILINKKILEFSWFQRTKLRSYLMMCYQNLPYKDYVKRNTSEFIQMMDTPVGDYCSGVLTNILRVLGECIICLFIFIFLGVKNFNALFMLLLLYGILFFIYNKYFIQKVVKYGKNAIKGSVNLHRYVNEGVGGLKEIRILGKENYFHTNVVESAKYQARNVVKSQIITLAPKYFVELLLIVFILLLSSIMAINGESLSVLLSNIAIFGFAAVRLTPSVNIISTGITGIKYGSGATEKIFNEIQDYQKLNIEIDEPGSFKSVEINKSKFKKLTLNDVSFKYDSKGSAILENINISIKKGESIGIIGESGSGKTTLIDLLLGLLPINEGKILFNDIPLKDNIELWRDKVAYIPQEIFLIDDTIANNISLGSDSDSNNRIIKALKAAKLDSFVNSLPNGIKSNIGQNGIMLSGGQRQRISLARAFYHDRDVLILDEATSALDNEIEQQIIKEVQSLKNKKTLIIITHRTSSLIECDKIYKIKGGKIIKSGNNKIVEKIK
tara:strand:- start:37490 stop:39268 length:1779 start_codon:yes stop_codon:yes gene_type:complete